MPAVLLCLRGTSRVDLNSKSAISDNASDNAGVYSVAQACKNRQFDQLPLENLMANCPVCDAEVEIAADTVVGELMSCEDCGCELEVLSLEPVKLGEAPEAEEDWGE